MKAIMQIELEQLMNKQSLHNITSSQRASLISIKESNGLYNSMANDILQVSNGKNDYRFKATNVLTTKGESKIVNLGSSNMLVYPNPASNNLSLEFINASDENATVTIFDALGQRIYQVRSNIKAGKLSIDISSLAKGLYHVQLLDTNNKSLSNSFIKQ